jgi:hypothetical protein
MDKLNHTDRNISINDEENGHIVTKEDTNYFDKHRNILRNRIKNKRVDALFLEKINEELDSSFQVMIHGPTITKCIRMYLITLKTYELTT